MLLSSARRTLWGLWELDARATKWVAVRGAGTTRLGAGLDLYLNSFLPCAARGVRVKCVVRERLASAMLLRTLFERPYH
eukprot:scaffold209_cov396-Prasinococcus_capsulatus_cf.AAC.3